MTGWPAVPVVTCHCWTLTSALPTLLEVASLHATPITDLKHPPASGVDVGILEGCVNNSAGEQVARQMRARCNVLVALGDCAVFGGVPAMRNGVCMRDALRRAYVETESTAEGHVPNDPELATMQDRDRSTKSSKWMCTCPAVRRRQTPSSTRSLNWRRAASRNSPAKTSTGTNQI